MARYIYDYIKNQSWYKYRCIVLTSLNWIDTYNVNVILYTSYFIKLLHCTLTTQPYSSSFILWAFVVTEIRAHVV